MTPTRPNDRDTTNAHPQHQAQILLCVYDSGGVGGIKTITRDNFSDDKNIKQNIFRSSLLMHKMYNFIIRRRRAAVCIIHLPQIQCELIHQPPL